MEFRNLSETDFESVSKDILEVYLSISLQVFAKGKDGGIDIKGFEGTNIIGQAKHYYLSPYSTLISSLKKEKTKVDKLQPKSYYLFISQNLSPENIKEIRSLFKSYMADESHIFTLNRIEGFLLEEKYRPVLLKHTKLWFFSHEILQYCITNIRNFDSIANRIDDKNFSKYFVRTNCFWKADRLLKENNVIIIKGDAGVGKTTTSEMLANLYTLRGFIPIMSNSNDIDEIKKHIIDNKDKRIVIVIDDFLGQRYFELRDKEISQFRTLIAYVQNNDRIKLILNSRITVMNDAIDRNIDFNNTLSNAQYNYEINMNDINRIERAKILVSLINKNNIHSEFRGSLIKTKSYFDIIDHRNYTPRVIEHLICNYQSEDLQNIKTYILKILDDAYLMWDNEFTHKIKLEDRLFVLVIYSLSDTYVPYDIVWEVYNNLITKLNLDASFESCVKRLNESFISLYIHKGVKYFKLKNPSVNDFLDAKIEKDLSLIYLILDNSLYFEQLFNVFKSVKKVVEMYNLDNRDIFGLKIASINQFWIEKKMNIYHFIYLYKIKNSIYEKRLVKIKISDLDTDSIEHMYDIYTAKELIEFYGFKIYDNFDLFIETFELSNAYHFVRGLSILDEKIMFSEIQITILLNLLERKLYRYYVDNIENYMDDALYRGGMMDFLSVFEKYEYNDFSQIPSEEVIGNVREAVKDLAEEMMSNYLVSEDISKLRKEFHEYFENYDYLNITYILDDSKLYKFLEDYMEHQARIEYEADKYYDDHKIEQMEKNEENKYISGLFKDEL